jgi:uncharacterized protein
MEEILASIRKIIEDSDGIRKSADEMTRESSDTTGTVEVEAFRADLASRAVPDVAPLLEHPTEISAPRFGREEESQAWTEATERQWPDSDETTVTVDETDLMPEVPSPAAEAKAEPVLSQSAGETRSAILSERTERQIAQSFGELSEAFLASRRKSFDEMAEEMLRPMLQDWLDNNLPVLVERLVREEIERIARGAAG